MELKGESPQVPQGQEDHIRASGLYPTMLRATEGLRRRRDTTGCHFRNSSLAAECRLD